MLILLVIKWPCIVLQTLDLAATLIYTLTLNILIEQPSLDLFPSQTTLKTVEVNLKKTH